MLRSLTATLFALGVIGAPVLAQKNYYCQGTSSAKIGNDTKSSTMKAWMKGYDKLRMEETARGRTIITIVNGKEAWVLSPQLKRGVHRTRSPKELKETAGRRALGNDIVGFRKEGGKRLRQEKVEGETCDFYEVKKGRITHRLWVLPGPDQLTKKRHSFASANQARSSGAPSQTQAASRQVIYTWKFDVPMPDSLFVVPIGYKIEEAGAAPPRRAPGNGTAP